eukprot:COSAG04_NODE_517_length_13186_cov_7.434248_14_plen_179_part_00
MALAQPKATASWAPRCRAGNAVSPRDSARNGRASGSVSSHRSDAGQIVVSPATSATTGATRRPASTASICDGVANEHGSRVHNVLFRDEPRWRTTTPRNDTSRDDSREYDHCATMAELLDLETLDVGFVDASQSCRGLSRQQQVSSSAPRSSHDERPHLHVLFSVLIGRGGAGGRWSK